MDNKCQMKIRVEYISFETRAARTTYLAERFSRYLVGRTLDVGCDEAHLKELLPDIEYTGVDIAGNPDIRLDLEKVEWLPFLDSSYDCVICVDVLEHLDNLHRIFGELIRVAKKNLIISLPNCWSVARRPLERGKGSFAHYGLPQDLPSDRHKWFFSLSQAREFVLQQGRRYGISIAELHATEKPRLSLVRVLRKIRYPKQESYLNRYAHTLWVVFYKAEVVRQNLSMIERQR